MYSKVWAGRIYEAGGQYIETQFLILGPILWIPLESRVSTKAQGLFSQGEGLPLATVNGKSVGLTYLRWVVPFVGFFAAFIIVMIGGLGGFGGWRADRVPLESWGAGAVVAIATGLLAWQAHAKWGRLDPASRRRALALGAVTGMYVLPEHLDRLLVDRHLSKAEREWQVSGPRRREWRDLAGKKELTTEQALIVHAIATYTSVRSGSSEDASVAEQAWAALEDWEPAAPQK